MSGEAAASLALARRGQALDDRTAVEGPRERFLIALISRLNPTSGLLHPIYERLLYGIRTQLAVYDCSLLLSTTRPTSSDDEAYREIVVERAIEYGAVALIAWGMSNNGPEVKQIVDSGLPAMFIDNDVFGTRAGYVMSANVDGSARAVRHLYETGRRRIAHIAGNLSTRPGPDRLLGYRSELEALGLSTPAEYVQNGDFMHESGYEAATKLLALPEPPDAITCASDWMAIGAMAAIEGAGLRVPEDIAVTGFDDIELAARVDPSLTTLRQNAVAMGAAAGGSIVRMLEDPDWPPPVIVVPTELVVRESSRAKPSRTPRAGKAPRTTRRS